MTFYSVDWWAPEVGPSRAHFRWFRDAVTFALRQDSEIEIEISKHTMKADVAAVLAALDAAASLGNGDGFTGYPGETEIVWTGGKP